MSASALPTRSPEQGLSGAFDTFTNPKVADGGPYQPGPSFAPRLGGVNIVALGVFLAAVGQPLHAGQAVRIAGQLLVQQDMGAGEMAARQPPVVLGVGAGG
jgi:hypothetical protein